MTKARFFRIGTILAIFIIIFFFAKSLTRHYDYPTYQSIIKARSDDWGTYARYALDIKQNGLIIQELKGTSYRAPAGFLYNYFIALLLALFGEKSIPIFVVQHLMLGLSVALIYWTFRDKMSPFLGLLFLSALFIFALKDVYKNYAPLLLSENLALFTLSLFFFCFVRGFDRDVFTLQLLAAVFMGISVLTRPNIVVYEFALIFPVIFYYFKKKKAWFTKSVIFVSVLVLSSSFLLVRNYASSGEMYFLPTHGTSMDYIKTYIPIPPSVDLSRAETNVLYAKLHLKKDVVAYAEYIIQKPVLFFTHYFKKFLYCLGYIPILDPHNGPRGRWMVMWACYFAYLVLRVARRYTMEMWELGVHLFIFCYYAALILGGQIQNYGFRMLIPAVFFVPAFGFIMLDKLWPEAKAKMRMQPRSL